VDTTPVPKEGIRGKENITGEGIPRIPNTPTIILTAGTRKRTGRKLGSSEKLECEREPKTSRKRSQKQKFVDAKKCSGYRNKRSGQAGCGITT